MPEDEIYTITFEQVEETAREFNAVAIRTHGRVIIFDELGFGLIREFETSQIGLVHARRYAVRLDVEDEMSNLSFEDLCNARRKELES